MKNKVSLDEISIIKVNNEEEKKTNNNNINSFYPYFFALQKQGTSFAFRERCVILNGDGRFPPT